MLVNFYPMFSEAARAFETEMLLRPFLPLGWLLEERDGDKLKCLKLESNQACKHRLLTKNAGARAVYSKLVKLTQK